MNRWLLGLFMSLIFLSGGCRKPESASMPAVSEQGYMNRAQPKLPTVKLWLGSQEVVAEVARTPVQLQTGMMFRTNMAENTGMLFVFTVPHRAAFWMKNTRIELDIVFIGADRRVVSVARRAQPCRKEPCELYAPSANAAYALEIAGGLSERHGFAAGDLVEFGATPRRPPASGRP